MTSSRASADTQNAGGNYKLLGGIALVLGVVMVLAVFFSHRGLYQSFRLRQERLRLEQENVKLAAKNERLARTIDRLHHDPEFIQDLIRQELNFVKKNEIIFQFPPEAAQTAAAPAPKVTGASSPPDRIHSVSERKVGKSQWSAAPPAGSAKKRVGHQRQ